MPKIFYVNNKQPPVVFCEVHQSGNFIKKETLAQVFFREIFKNTFFTEHLWMTASD